MTNTNTNTFEDFKRSFFYGSRSDLNFKFLTFQLMINNTL